MSGYTTTITSIAKTLNLAPSTVSRALNDHFSISQETKNKVTELARKLGYQPNLNASNLVSRRTCVIGLVIPEVTAFFFTTVIRGIKDELEPRGYKLIILQSNESYKIEEENLKYLTAVRVDGILFSPTLQTTDSKHLKPVIVNKVPFVNFDRNCGGNEFFQVMSDDEYGAFRAVQHLIDVGCKRIAHIGGPKTARNALNRLNGYLRALKSNGMEVPEKMIIETDFSIGKSIDPIKAMFNKEDVPDGIFAVNDATAIGCMYILKEKGLTAPLDVAIVGYDDETYSKYLTPSLSSVKNPIYEMGKIAAQMCLAQIANDHIPVERKLLKPKLVIRQSSKKGRVLHYA